jgi:hypothetical protein
LQRIYAIFSATARIINAPIAENKPSFAADRPTSSFFVKMGLTSFSDLFFWLNFWVGWLSCKYLIQETGLTTTPGRLD